MREIISTLDEETRDIMEATMKDWQKRRRGGSAYETSSGVVSNEGNTGMPLSQGEWDEGLGLPLCVVCHNVCVKAGNPPRD
jgi:dynein light intermediate chain 1